MEYEKAMSFHQLRHMRDEVRRIQRGLDLWVEDLLTEEVDKEQEEEEESGDVEYVKTCVTNNNKRTAVGGPQMSPKSKIRRWLLTARPELAERSGLSTSSATASAAAATTTTTKATSSTAPPPPAPPAPVPPPDRNFFEFLPNLDFDFLKGLDFDFQEEPELAALNFDLRCEERGFNTPTYSPTYSPLPSSPSEVEKSLIVISSDEEDWERDIDIDDLLPF